MIWKTRPPEYGFQRMIPASRVPGIFHKVKNLEESRKVLIFWCPDLSGRNIIYF